MIVDIVEEVCCESWIVEVIVVFEEEVGLDKPVFPSHEGIKCIEDLDGGGNEPGDLTVDIVVDSIERNDC